MHNPHNSKILEWNFCKYECVPMIVKSGLKKKNGVVHTCYKNTDETLL